MSLDKEVADRLESAVFGGFDIFKISKEAFRIYQELALELDGELDADLLSLMAMEEGEEFELTEKEFRELLFRMRARF